MISSLRPNQVVVNPRLNIIYIVNFQIYDLRINAVRVGHDTNGLLCSITENNNSTILFENEIKLASPRLCHKLIDSILKSITLTLTHIKNHLKNKSFLSIRSLTERLKLHTSHLLRILNGLRLPTE